MVVSKGRGLIPEFIAVQIPKKFVIGAFMVWTSTCGELCINCKCAVDRIPPKTDVELPKGRGESLDGLHDNP